MKTHSSPDCPFCEPQSSSISFYKFREFRAIYNRSPIVPGHSLVIPRHHIQSLLDLSDDEIRDMMVFARQVTENLSRIFPATGFNWTIQDGAAAGQTVPHLHVHVIPRYDGDLPHPGDWYPRILKNEQGYIDNSDEREWLSVDEMGTIVRHIRDNWER
jgi:bis(5'-adenosyl)-triphosphatase